MTGFYSDDHFQCITVATEICSIQPEHAVYTVLYPTMQLSGLCSMHTENYEKLQKY